MTIEDIMAAIASSDRADLATIRLYIQWIRIRRRVNHRFYFQAHWISGQPGELPAYQAHWI